MLACLLTRPDKVFRYQYYQWQTTLAGFHPERRLAGGISVPACNKCGESMDLCVSYVSCERSVVPIIGKRSTQKLMTDRQWIDRQSTVLARGGCGACLASIHCRLNF